MSSMCASKTFLHEAHARVFISEYIESLRLCASASKNLVTIADVYACAFRRPRLVLRRWWPALALLLAGCGGVVPGGIAALDPTAGPENAVARITYRDGTTEYISQPTVDQFQQRIFVGPTGPAPLEDTLNELITYELLLRQARDSDISADPYVVERSVDNLRGQFCAQQIQQSGQLVDFDDERAVLDACGQALGFGDGDDLTNFIAEQVTINDVIAEKAGRDQIQSAHILFSPDADAARGNVPAFTRAEQAYVELCGEQGSITQPVDQPCEELVSFEDMARERSDEPAAAESGGELPPFNEQGLTDDGQPFDSTFVTNTWALKDQFESTGTAISRPFQTDFGWHIVKILDLVASQPSRDSYRAGILQRALDSTVDDLNDPGTAEGPVPLIGVAEILVELPEQPAPPTPEPLLPEPSPSPEP